MSGPRQSFVSPERPFAGLRPFAYEDHNFFFGREEQTYALYRLIDRNRFIAIVGSSGSGKSSLVRAGLLPLLDEETRGAGGRAWVCGEMRPGDAPLRRLMALLASLSTDADPIISSARRERIAAHLRGSSFGVAEALNEIGGLGEPSIMLVIDQFEEVFRYASSNPRGTEEQVKARDEATQFVQLLLEASRSRAHKVHVLLTMRSDFIGDCARFYGLPEAVSVTQFLVPALTRDQLEEVVCKPVEKAGATIEPELVERLLNDCSNEPDQLPVLQHCLLRLWEEAGGVPPQTVSNAVYSGAPVDVKAGAARHLALDHYRIIGGFADALSRHADEILKDLTGSEKIVEELFRALADTTADGKVIRRPQSFGDLIAVTGATENRLRPILNAFRRPGVSFITPYSEAIDAGTIIDVSHEALIRRWDKIADPQQGWLQREIRDGLIWHSLVVMAESFEKNPKSLLSEAATEDRDKWLEGRNEAWALRYGGGWLAVDELMKSSRQEVERRRHQEKEYLERERAEQKRALQQTKRWLAVVGLCALAAVAFGLWALRERTNAQTSLRVAEEQKKQADDILEDAASIMTLQDQMVKGAKEKFLAFTARERFEKASEKGDARAMTWLGFLYFNGHGVAQDYGKAREWYEKAADKGHATAMTSLGVVYFNGHGVAQDYGKAREWYGKAADKGDVSAMFNLGLLYVNGHGVAQDYVKAREWWETAGEKGDAGATTNLGLLYENGYGVMQDYGKAREWYEKAAEKGEARAMFNLGLLYENGYGVMQDYGKAREWYEKAADKGHATAMTSLGVVYFNGYGVTQDYGKAREWWEKAGEKGDESAKVYLERLPISEAAAAGRHPEALQLQEALATKKEAVETKREGKPGKETALALHEVAWAALFARDYTRALSVSERAHALLPEDLGIETNRAHALMFLERSEEAQALYLAHKGKPMSEQDSKLWERVIADDFVEFRKTGLTHPMMADIEKELGVSR